MLCYYPPRIGKVMFPQVCITHSIQQGGWPAAKVTTPPSPTIHYAQVGGMHPTGMHSCSSIYYSNIIIYACIFTYNKLTLDFIDVSVFTVALNCNGATSFFLLFPSLPSALLYLRLNLKFRILLLRVFVSALYKYIKICFLNEKYICVPI